MSEAPLQMMEASIEIHEAEGDQPRLKAIRDECVCPSSSLLVLQVLEGP